MNCYGCHEAETMRERGPERNVLIRCKLKGKLSMCFVERNEKYMTQAEAPDWCPKIGGGKDEMQQV